MDFLRPLAEDPHQQRHRTPEPGDPSLNSGRCHLSGWQLRPDGRLLKAPPCRKYRLRHEALHEHEIPGRCRGFNFQSRRRITTGCQRLTILRKILDSTTVPQYNTSRLVLWTILDYYNTRRTKAKLRACRPFFTDCKPSPLLIPVQNINYSSNLFTRGVVALCVSVALHRLLASHRNSLGSLE